MDSAKAIKDISEDTRKIVRFLIGEAYESGMSVNQAAALIRSRLGSGEPARAKTIAATEMRRLANGAASQPSAPSTAATGDPFTKTWLTASGAEHPRHDDYEGLDRQTVGLNEVFDVGGYPLTIPGDPNLPRTESIQCRCTVIFGQAEGGD